jgi:hypothetical protein
MGRKPRPDADYLSHLMPREAARLRDLDEQLEALRAEARKIQASRTKIMRQGNSRRQHSEGRSSMAKLSAARGQSA